LRRQTSSLSTEAPLCAKSLLPGRRAITKIAAKPSHQSSLLSPGSLAGLPRGIEGERGWVADCDRSIAGEVFANCHSKFINSPFKKSEFRMPPPPKKSAHHPIIASAHPPLAHLPIGLFAHLHITKTPPPQTQSSSPPHLL
jgi:hypothetical protein